jgi:hypothetical protein
MEDRTSYALAFGRLVQLIQLENSNDTAAKTANDFIKILFLDLFRIMGLKRKNKRHHLEIVYASRRCRMTLRAK